jgi:hypothetical protein
VPVVNAQRRRPEDEGPSRDGLRNVQTSKRPAGQLVARDWYTRKMAVQTPTLSLQPTSPSTPKVPARLFGPIFIVPVDRSYLGS